MHPPYPKSTKQLALVCLNIVFELICVLICKLYVTSLSEEVGGNVQVRQLLQIIYYHRGDYLKEQLIEK